MRPVMRVSMALALALLAVPAFAQGTVEKLSGDVQLLTGKSGNVLLVPDRGGVLLIDDERESDAEELKAAVRQVAPNGSVRMVVNTHWHLDHCGGNEILAKDGAAIVAQRNVRARRSAPQFMSAYNRTIPAGSPASLPTVVFDDRMTIYAGDETVQLRHTPNAHTDGDTLVRLEQANVLHMGDVFFNGLFPFIDRDTGGSIQGLIKAVDIGLSMSDDKTKVVPAHGDVTNKAGLQTYRNMLNEVATQVQKLAAAGKTLQQVQDAKLTDRYKLEGNGERFVAAIYDSYTRK